MRLACVRKDAPGSRMLTKAVFLICSLAAAVQATFVNWTNPAVVDGELSYRHDICQIFCTSIFPKNGKLPEHLRPKIWICLHFYS